MGYFLLSTFTSAGIIGNRRAYVARGDIGGSGFVVSLLLIDEVADGEPSATGLDWARTIHRESCGDVPEATATGRPFCLGDHHERGVRSARRGADEKTGPKEQVQKSNPLDLKTSLEVKGYKRLPLVRDTLGSLHLTYKLGGRERSALIDTGADNTVFSEVLAKELKCDLTAESKAHDNIGGSASMRRSRVPASCVKGDLAFIGDVIVCEDFERKMFAGVREKNGVSVLIGMDTLRYHSAIIDCGQPALYIREANTTDQGLNGEWQAVTQTREGVLMDTATVRSLALSIRKNVLVYNNGKRGIPFDLTLHDFNRNPKAMDWREENGPANLPAIYSLGGDTLKVCGNLTQSKALLRPSGFESTKANGYSVITFRRVPPKDGQDPVVKSTPKPSVEIDLKALLEPSGFKRLALKREPLGTLYVSFTLGGSECTALLDTGASATFMSDRLVLQL